MSKKLSTYYSNNSDDYCELHFDYKEEYAYLIYKTEEGTKYFEEIFPNKSLKYVEDAAENWSMGRKNISELSNQQYTLNFKKAL